ncbi:META domain-containing protein [Caulobacter sp. 17J65-9]|uniref:META domain-containing protein n=1 Tax=Caulobacter sp. 17J65-9 TaxID=2709382 RepID=UPI0013D7FAE2
MRTWAVAATFLGLTACAFQAWHEPAGEQLTGSEWVLRDATGMPPLRGSSLTLLLAPEGEVSGSGGCNRFVGRWTKQRGRLTMSGMASTMMACPDNAVMEQEQAFLKSLEGTSLFTATPGKLVLQTHDGHVFTFASAP